MTSFENEMVVLHCSSIGVTFSRVQENRNTEQNEKTITLQIKDAFI